MECFPRKAREAKFLGRVGAELDVDAGRKAAYLAALNVLAVARKHLGSLDKVSRIVRLGVSVATSDDIRDHPRIADAASELLQNVFGKDRALPCGVWRRQPSTRHSRRTGSHVRDRGLRVSRCGDLRQHNPDARTIPRYRQYHRLIALPAGLWSDASIAADAIGSARRKKEIHHESQESTADEFSKMILLTFLRRSRCLKVFCMALFVSCITASFPLPAQAQSQGKECPVKSPTLYRTVKIDGLSIFYREAGPKDAPTILLLHGLPSSSRMFEPLLARLSDRYHLVAPDYPGFGHSDWPDPKNSLIHLIISLR